MRDSAPEGLLPPGTYRFDLASADFQAFTDNVSIFLNASSGTEAARPDGAPATSSSGTWVFLSIFDNNDFSFTFACLMLDRRSDFAIDNRVNQRVQATGLLQQPA